MSHNYAVQDQFKREDKGSSLNGLTPSLYTVKDEVFSFFKRPIKNTTPYKNIDLLEAYKIITSHYYAANTAKARTLDGKQYKDYKSANFDYATFNGTFSERSDNGYKTLSGYFIIDIDHLTDKLQQVFQRLEKDTVLSPQLIFRSPSGDGLKIVVKIDPSIVDTTKKSGIMENIWQAVNAYFSKEYADLITPSESNAFIDEACKDLSRACFFCHDAAAYLNINEDSILGQSFIDAYPAIDTGKKRSKKERSKKVNPATSLEDLAKRHLLEKDNHTPQLVAFIGAAKNIGVPQNHAFDFIVRNVNISPDSSKIDHDNLKDAVEDIYSRYGTDTEGIDYLTPLTFGYNILFFKFSKDANQFILTSLYWNEVRNVLHSVGFAKRKVGKSFIYIQKNGCIIREVTPEIMRDYLTGYVERFQESVSFTYQGEDYQIPPAAIREVYLKNSNNIFNAVWLEHLQVHDTPILKDKEKETYFFFKNDLVAVSKDGIKTEKWEDQNEFCIWEDQIIQHEFIYQDDYSTGHFYNFLQNVTNNDPARLATMCSGIGYLLHHYFRESEGQAVIFYDEAITDTQTPMGGSGKGLIVNGVKQVRKVTKLDGKHFAEDNRFKFELVSPATQVAWIDDVKQDFDFSVLHSNQTDGWTVERKHKPQFFIEPKDSPKTVICSNSIIKGGGTTNKRRQFIVELSDYYSRQIIRGDEKPIEETHGGLFFSASWDRHEWNMFFSAMIDCSIYYFQHGLVPHAGINVELNRFRQATDEDFATWAEEQGFEEKKRYETRKYYEPYVATYYGNSHQIGQRKFTGYLKEFANYKKWNFEVIRSNGIAYFRF